MKMVEIALSLMVCMTLGGMEKVTEGQHMIENHPKEETVQELDKSQELYISLMSSSVRDSGAGVSYKTGFHTSGTLVMQDD
jgi:hypothetical protein